MLRALVAVLVLANLGFWAWSAGALEAVGLAPARERDPARLALQVRPDVVRVLPPAAAIGALGAASSPADSPLLCLEAGPFAATAIEAAERALSAAALPAGSWLRLSQDIGAQYAVVLGPFTSRDAAQKIGEELKRLPVAFEQINLPADAAGAPVQPGLALGRYDSRNAADSALASFTQRGVPSAWVAVLRAAASESRLRVDNATAALAEQVRAISAAALGAGFVPCAAR